MNRTEIHIERLVLDGLDFGPADVRTLRAVLESDLVRVFARDGVGERVVHGSAMDAPVRSTPAAPGSPAALGGEAAIAIYRSVVRPAL